MGRREGRVTNLVISYYSCVCLMHVCLEWAHTCYGAHVEVKGDLSGIDCLLLRWFQGLNKGC